MSYFSFSKSIARYLTTNTEPSSQKEDILTYAIEIFIITLIDVVFAILLGSLLGVLVGTIICIVTVAAFRYTAGGAHSTSAIKCAIITIIIFPSLAYFANYLSHINNFNITYFSVGALFIGFVMISYLAPVESLNAPIISIYRKRKLKVLSIGFVSLVSLIVIILIKINLTLYSEYILCLDLSILWVSFILSRSGHKFMSVIDKISLRR